MKVAFTTFAEIKHQIRIIMARPIRTGMDYFPMDVNFFHDIRIRRLLRACGEEGVSVYLALLCKIYENGYFLEAEEDLAFFISEEVKLDESRVAECMGECVRLGLFSVEMLEDEGVYTSREIQEQYRKIAKCARRKAGIRFHSLLEEEREEREEKEEKEAGEKTADKVENVAGEETQVRPVAARKVRRREDDVSEEEAREAFERFRAEYPGEKRDTDTELKDFMEGKRGRWKCVAVELPERLVRHTAWRANRRKAGIYVPDQPSMKVWLETNAAY